MFFVRGEVLVTVSRAQSHFPQQRRLLRPHVLTTGRSKRRPYISPIATVAAPLAAPRHTEGLADYGGGGVF